MKGRSKGRALERRPFEKSCSKKDAQKKAFHVRDVSWEQSAHRNRGTFGACLALQSSPIARKTRP